MYSLFNLNYSKNMYKQTGGNTRIITEILEVPKTTSFIIAYITFSNVDWPTNEKINGSQSPQSATALYKLRHTICPI